MKQRTGISFLLFKQQLIRRKQFIIFLIVGGINTVFSYSVYAASLFVGLHYTVAALIAFIAGPLFSFFTMGNIVFKQCRARNLMLFLISSIIICAVNLLLLKCLGFFMNYYLAGIISSLVIPFISFFLNKNFVFNVPREYSS